MVGHSRLGNDHSKWRHDRLFRCFAEGISSLQVAKMFRLGARRFTTTARKAAEAVAQMEGPNPYGIKVSTAQGVVKGLVGGEFNA
jgi:hypothetical protein